MLSDTKLDTLAFRRDQREARAAARRAEKAGADQPQGDGAGAAASSSGGAGPAAAPAAPAAPDSEPPPGPAARGSGRGSLGRSTATRRGRGRADESDPFRDPPLAAPATIADLEEAAISGYSAYYDDAPLEAIRRHDSSD